MLVTGIVNSCLYLSLLLCIGILWSYHWSAFIFLYVITSLAGAIIWICCKRCSRWSWVTIWTLVAIAIITLVTVTSSSFLLWLEVMVVVAVLLLHPVVVAGVVVGVVGCCCFWILMVLLIPGKVARAALTLDPLILWWPEAWLFILQNARNWLKINL